MMGDINIMDHLTSEQKEYIGLMKANENIWRTLKGLQENNKIPAIPSPHSTYGNSNIYFMHENYFYVFMELLEGKQPELLKEIIDRSK